MDYVKQLCVRTPQDNYSIQLSIPTTPGDDWYLSIVDISPTIKVGDKEVDRVVCRKMKDGEAPEPYTPHWPSGDALALMSLLCCRKFIHGEIAPIGYCEDGTPQLNLGQYLVDLKLLPLPDDDELIKLLLPQGKELFDWCEYDILCWLLNLLYSQPGKESSVGPADFLSSGETSFPYSEALVGEVFRSVINDGVGIDCCSTGGPALIFSGRHRSTADAIRKVLETELMLPVTQGTKPQQPDTAGEEYDVFLCLASEDVDVADPIHAALTEAEVKVFYYKASIEWGDSIPKEINTGLASCQYGIPILSKAFFSKPYPRAELDALAERQNSTGQKTLLPIWHGLTKQDIVTAYPLLAPIQAVMSTESVDSIVGRVKDMLAQ